MIVSASAHRLGKDNAGGVGRLPATSEIHSSCHFLDQDGCQTLCSVIEISIIEHDADQKKSNLNFL